MHENCLNDDKDAWAAYPQHRRWFNKLEFSMQMCYTCGPNGVAPTTSGMYVVRPIYNLLGMGLGAHMAYIEAGDTRKVPPGSFWCERFEGTQTSVTYEWRNGWHQVSAWRGELAPGDLSRFTSWKRVDDTFELTQLFDQLYDVGTINVEFIGTNPIEVHLRRSPDPETGSELIPVWADTVTDEEWLPSFDDGEGFLEVPRLGFIVRQ